MTDTEHLKQIKERAQNWMDVPRSLIHDISWLCEQLDLLRKRVQELEADNKRLTFIEEQFKGFQMPGPDVPLLAAKAELQQLRAERDELRRDKERLDWLEAQSNGQHWIARQSETGRGFRLHNTQRQSEDGPIPAPTARDAIDQARHATPGSPAL